MRTVDRAGAPPPRPSRPSFAETVYDLAEARAMVGLTALAAEGLPGGHAREFGSILETIYSKLGVVLDTLQHGAGQPPLEPVEA